MIAQNYMVEFSNRSQYSPMDLKSSENLSNKSTTNFKNVLDNSMSKDREKSPEVLNNGKQSNPTEWQSRSISGGGKVRTYREIARANPQKVQQIEGEERQVPAEKTEDVEVAKLEAKAEVVIDSLASILGVEAGEIQKLLKSLNIESHDLADPVKVDQIVDKLSKYIGLDENQTKVLGSAIFEINKQVEKLLTSDKPSFQLSDEPIQHTDNDRKDWVKLEGVDLQVIDVSTIKTDNATIVSQLKMKIDEMANQMNQSQESFSAEIAEIVKSILPKVKLQNDTNSLNKVQVLENEAELVEKVVEVSNPEKNVQIAQNLTKEEKAAGKNTEKEQNDTEIASQQTEPELSTSKAVNSASDEHPQSLENIAVSQASKSIFEVLKAEKTMQTPNKSEILHQVIEKAKVILSGDKSEMIMNLNPESLGKLSLKIVTERGIVAAQFVAESQQVKEVLETNMQFLKDSLEKQGLSIQGLSVSVGQEKNREFGREQYNEGRSGSNGTKNNSVGKGSIITSGLVPDNQRLNSYKWNDSSINLTA